MGVRGARRHHHPVPYRGHHRHRPGQRTTASARPTDPASAAFTRGADHRRRDRSRRTPSACTTCTATWRSWCRTAPRKCQATAAPAARDAAGSCRGGELLRSAYSGLQPSPQIARPTVAGARRTVATTSTARPTPRSPQRPVAAAEDCRANIQAYSLAYPLRELAKSELCGVLDRCPNAQLTPAPDWSSYERSADAFTHR